MRDFMTDSVEDRVLAFQRRISRLTSLTNDRSKSGVPAAIVAASAFLVGRGTSHLFLLRRLSGRYPSAAIWFGLMAALAGVGCWDPEWTRFSKNIERQLRAGFTWSDASGFDLCWEEFRWLAKTFKGPDIFFSLSRLVSSAISVELLPGVSCQFRISRGDSTERDSPHGTDEGQRERLLSEVLAQFVSLASSVRPLLEEKGSGVQRSLDLNRNPAGTGKASKARKPRSKNP